MQYMFPIYSAKGTDYLNGAQAKTLIAAGR